MSAIATPEFSTPSNRPAPMPAPKPPRSAKWPILAGLVVIAAAAWFLRAERRSPAAVEPSVRTVKAVRGTLLRTRRITGTIEAETFANIAAPMMRGADAGRGMVLINLAENGAAVRKGQEIAMIDGQFIRDHLDDMESQVNQSDLELRKLEADQTAEMEAANQRVRAAKAQLDQATQDMRAAGIRSTIDREILRLSLEEARATYQDARNEISLIRERQEAQRRIAEINRESQVRHRDRHRADIVRFTVKAPMDGQAVLKPINRRGQIEQVRIGDELSPGQPFMRVVDVGSMRLDGTLSQSDSEIIRIGQRATVRFDAYPDLVMDGEVQSVGALAVSGRRASYYVRTIPVRIAIQGKDPRVIPDLTASADVVLEQDEGIVIPREAVQESDGRPVVLLREGETLTPRPVEIGAYGSTQVSVTAGLQEGDEIAIQP